MSRSSTIPPTIAKESVSNKATHTPPIGIGTREANVCNKVANIPCTRENPILLGQFQDYMNKIVGEDTSLDKDFDTLVRIIKLPPIASRTHSNTRIKRKLSITLNNMVDATKQGNKMLILSIDKIHTINLEIKDQCSQTQEKALEITN